jgi:hypothetical protein
VPIDMVTSTEVAMSRILYTLGALGFLAVAVLTGFDGEWHLALASLGIMLVLFVLAVVADRSGEGMPDTPPPSRP